MRVGQYLPLEYGSLFRERHAGSIKEQTFHYNYAIEHHKKVKYSHLLLSESSIF